MDISLSSEDILKSLKYQCNLIAYEDMHKIKNIDELLNKYNKCVILYQSSPNYGHWTCIWLYKNILYYFDSYGFKPDVQLLFVGDRGSDIRISLNSNYPYLSNLMIKSPYNIDYNDIMLQDITNDTVATCGRYVILRLLNPTLSHEKFKKLLSPKLNGVESYDAATVKLTKKILNK